MSPKSYDNIILVNKRRKNVGLNTLEEQTKVMRQQAIDNHRSPPTDGEERRKKYDQWRLKVGWL